jgi:hypothetical protein
VDFAGNIRTGRIMAAAIGGRADELGRNDRRLARTPIGPSFIQSDPYALIELQQSRLDRIEPYGNLPAKPSKKPL